MIYFMPMLCKTYSLEVSLGMICSTGCSSDEEGVIGVEDVGCIRNNGVVSSTGWTIVGIDAESSSNDFGRIGGVGIGNEFDSASIVVLVSES